MTGAAGFVGANLVRRLVTLGVPVHVLVPAGADLWRLTDLLSRVAVHDVDLADRSAVDRAVAVARARTIFHFAAHGAYSHQTDVTRIFRSNVEGTINLVEASTTVGFDAFIHSGTSSEYGIKSVPMREDMLLEPNSAYAVTKAAATLYGRHLAVSRDLPIVTLRLFSVYGAWEEPGRFMPTLLAHLLEGRLPPLVSPETARDFIHVDDVIDACLLAAERSPRGGAILNVGTGVQRTVRDAVNAAMAIANVHVAPVWASMAARSWDATTWVADPSEAEKVLGFRARHDLATGLANMFTWMRVHRGHYPPAGAVKGA